MSIENTIIVRGGAYRDVKRALQTWINLSADYLLKDICFEMYRNGRGNHVIRTDSRLPNLQFFYLVNYLTYPMNIEYKAQVRGYMQGEENRDWPAVKLMVYISAKDTEYDNVFLVNEENNNYKVPFALGEEVEEVSDATTYSMPVLSELIQPDVLSIQSEEIRKLEELEPIEDSSKKLKRAVFVFLAVCCFHFLFAFLIKDTDVFALITFATFIGPGFWFGLNHEMLRYEAIFNRCFSLAIGVFLYGYLLYLGARPMIPNYLYIWSLYPLTFLLIQWPLRRLYLKFFKREPRLDRTGKVGDVLYSIILYSSFIWPFLLFGEITP